MLPRLLLAKLLPALALVVFAALLARAAADTPAAPLNVENLGQGVLALAGN